MDVAEVLGWATVEAPEAVTRHIDLHVLRKHCTIVSVPTSVMLTCGHTCGLDSDTEIPELGTVMACTVCGEEGLVGQYPTADYAAVDDDGCLIPGLGVKPGYISTTVSAVGS